MGDLANQDWKKEKKEKNKVEKKGGCLVL